MVALAIGEHERWRASDLELGIGSPSFTTGTLQRFHDNGFTTGELFFLIGADAFAEIESWKDFPAILDRAHFAVVSRPGFPVTNLPARLPALASRMTGPSDAGTRGTPSIFLIDAPTASVSATAIRQRCANGQSITGLVTQAVREHIERHGLYSRTMTGEISTDIHRTSPAGRLHGQD
jgi:nicotinate-nucleotide adenylyltransferase